MDATLISGPAKIGIARSLSLAMELSETFTIEITFLACIFAYRKAANVSAVSPD